MGVQRHNVKDGQHEGCEVWAYVRFCSELLSVLLYCIGFCCGHLLIKWFTQDRRIDMTVQGRARLQDPNSPNTNAVADVNEEQEQEEEEGEEEGEADIYRL